ncbi:MAG: D-alanyl-D-alanine carboxypeptidase family protein, partial [Propionibacteriaceae bacterium]
DGHGTDPRLMEAFAKAQHDGASVGFTFSLNSSYRPPADQQQLLDEAIAKYGSVDEAMRWVMTPWDSAHVRGMAIDIQGTPEGQAWLWQNQAQFGLCRRYDNEPWHFELQASFPDSTCPPMRPSAGAS